VTGCTVDPTADRQGVQRGRGVTSSRGPVLQSLRNQPLSSTSENTGL